MPRCHSGSVFAVYDTMLPYLPGQWRFSGGARLVRKRLGDYGKQLYAAGLCRRRSVRCLRNEALGKIPTLGVQLNVKNVFDKTYYPSSNSKSPITAASGEARLVMRLGNTTFSF